jgi:hypothetical protein
MQGRVKISDYEGHTRFPLASVSVIAVPVRAYVIPDQV